MAGFKHITERRGRYKCVARFHVKPAMFIFENAEEADFETPSVERCKNVEIILRTLLGESKNRRAHSHFYQMSSQCFV